MQALSLQTPTDGLINLFISVLFELPFLELGRIGIFATIALVETTATMTV